MGLGVMFLVCVRGCCFVGDHVFAFCVVGCVVIGGMCVRVLETVVIEEAMDEEGGASAAGCRALVVGGGRRGLVAVGKG